MLTVASELAADLPEVWQERFDTDAAAAAELKVRQSSCANLASAVALSLVTARQRLAREGIKDVWTDISEADLHLLSSARPTSTATRYRHALARASDLAMTSARQQLELYRQLRVRPANVDAALQVFPPDPVAPDAPDAPDGPSPRAILFIGHRIDGPGRLEPRFPPQQEGAARQMIRAALSAELALPGGVVGGIAGGACGGDLLFHEVCAELGVKTELYLALPRVEFVAGSVAPGGPGWIQRFEQAYDRLGHRELATSPELPGWLRGKRDYDIWRRNNRWMLHNALAIGRDRVTLIALWDGEPGDGPGGTQDMVEQAKAHGARVVILDTRALFSLA